MWSTVCILSVLYATKYKGDKHTYVATCMYVCMSMPKK